MPKNKQGFKNDYTRISLLSFFVVFSFQIAPSISIAKNSCINVFQEKAPIQSFENKLSAVRNILSDTNQIYNLEKAAQLRVNFFSLEGLSRIFKQAYEIEAENSTKKEQNEKKEIANIFEDLRTTFKETEDALGQYSFPFEIVKMLNEVNKKMTSQESSQTLKTLIKHFEDKQTESKKNLKSYFEISGWKEHYLEIIANIRDTIRSIPWKKNKKIQKQIVLALIDIAKEMDELFPNDPYHPRKGELNPRILEDGGTHKARRLLRWLPIYFSSLHYFIEFEALQKGDIKSYIIDNSLIESKFSSIPASGMKNPIRIPQEHVLILNSWIARLGNAKDWGALEREMINSILETKIRVNEIDASKLTHEILSQYPDYQNYIIETIKIFEEIRDTDFLKKFIKALKQQLNE